MAKLAKIRDEGIAAQINQNAVNMPNTATGIAYLVTEYIKPRSGEDVAQDMSETMNAAPQTLRQFSGARITQHTDAMVAEVAADRKGVYEKVSAAYAMSVADEFLGSDKYKALRGAKKTGASLDQPFIALHDGNQDLADLVALAPQHAVERGATNALARERRKAMETEKLIKADGTYNRAGLGRYDASQTAALAPAETNVWDKQTGFQYAKEQDDTHFAMTA